MFKRWLSETARSLLWLWENDPDGWRVSEYSVAHPATGVGVWIANEVYGLKVYHDIPRAEASRAHILSGRSQHLKWRDRRALYRAMMRAPTARGGPIPLAISEWAMKGDKFIAAKVD